MLIVRTAIAVTLFSVLSSTAVRQANGCTATAAIVCMEQGAIRGVIDGQALAFKGVPYAQAPVEALRWKPPQPAGPPARCT
jgi:para-nitrobenzyl esterase